MGTKKGVRRINHHLHLLRPPHRRQIQTNKSIGWTRMILIFKSLKMRCRRFKIKCDFLEQKEIKLKICFKLVKFKVFYLS